MTDYFVYMVSLPKKVEGVTVPNDDGTYTVYINADLPECVQQAALDHELEHIEYDHLYSNKPIKVIEAEADGQIVPQQAATAPEVRTIPCFASPAQFRKYLLKTYRPPLHEGLLEWLCPMV